MSARQDLARPEGLSGLGASNVLYYFTYRMMAPSRLAGDAMVVHETLDQVAEPRLSWVYSASQRRVRRGLDDDGVAHRQRGRDLPGEHEQRKVPRNDLPDRADRLIVRKLGLHELRPTGVMVEMASDQRHVEVRPDVLVYTTEPLETDTEVTGPIVVTLYAATSAVVPLFTAMA